MLGLIGGTGLDKLPGLRIDEQRSFSTRYGAPSAALQLGRLNNQAVAFLPRHGKNHGLPPHAINYRANVYALKLAGVSHIVGVAAVGGISGRMSPAELVLPHDLIDYTWGRAHSYSLGDADKLQHVEFAPPYHRGLRQCLQTAAREAEVHLHDTAVHAVTQGPRLETAAEIQRLARDGADIVGMTGMPEAALAAELGLAYACLAVVVNWAAGITSGGIHEEIDANVEAGMSKALKLLAKFNYSADESGA